MQPRCTSNWVVVGAVLLAAGCSADRSAAAKDGGSSAALEARHARAPETWRARSPRGVEVRVEAHAYPFRSGEVELYVEIDSASIGHVVPVNVDLASPTMPMHGITRFPIRQAGPGQYVTVVEIPMEGRWNLYVNLNEEGTDAAEFEFEVISADSVTHAHDSTAHVH